MFSCTKFLVYGPISFSFMVRLFQWTVHGVSKQHTPLGDWTGEIKKHPRDQANSKRSLGQVALCRFFNIPTSKTIS